jgi:hypothetical protein
VVGGGERKHRARSCGSSRHSNVRYHEQAGIEGSRGSRAKGEVQITNGLGTLFASCGAVAWKEDFNLIRRLTHHCFVLSTALELAADDGNGSALVREKS